MGWWWWGGSYTSFFREVCGLELQGDLWDRAQAYEDTMQAACWWYPHSDFIIACERPTVIKRELVNHNVPRGWGSHRLHSLDGPAVGFRDGWGVYAVHGVRVPADIIEDNSSITVARIESETNAEVRRVMIDLYKGGRDAGGGPGAYLADSGATIIHEDLDPLGATRRLLRKEVPDDEPIVMIDVQNSTQEPDGSFNDAWGKAIELPDATFEPNTDLAWCAGFFDGEGTTYFHPTSAIGGLALSIVQKDKSRLERFTSQFSGGHWTLDQRSDCHHFTIHGREAFTALDKLWPYLSGGKREQALNVIRRICSPDAATRKPHASGDTPGEARAHCGRGHSMEDAYEPPTKGGRECATCRDKRRSGPQDEPFEWWRNPAWWMPGKIRPEEAPYWLRKSDPQFKRYQLRVDPNAYGGRASKDCLAAIASTWRDVDGSMIFPRPEDYAPEIES